MVRARVWVTFRVRVKVWVRLAVLAQSAKRATRLFKRGDIQNAP